MTEERVTLDLESLTLGEAIAAEDASGESIERLLATAARRRILALFVHRLRSSGSAPSWHELTSLRLLDAFSGRSPSPQASPSETSPPSD